MTTRSSSSSASTTARPGRDEVRARVILTSAAGQVSRESNLVIDDFNPAHA